MDLWREGSQAGRYGDEGMMCVIWDNSNAVGKYAAMRTVTRISASVMRSTLQPGAANQIVQRHDLLEASILRWKMWIFEH